MKRLQYLAVLPKPKWGIVPEYIGPFGSLSEAMRWGMAHGCPDYIAVTPPERWERMHAHDDDFIAANADAMQGPLVDLIHDEAYIEKTIDEYTREHDQNKAGLSLVPPDEARCLNCGVVIEHEPVLNDWGFCTASCEREWNEKQ